MLVKGSLKETSSYLELHEVALQSNNKIYLTMYNNTYNPKSRSICELVATIPPWREPQQRPAGLSTSPQPEGGGEYSRFFNRGV